jgi:hypothetical protein
MTQDEIIEMVMQIGGCDRPEDDSPALKMFVTFAKLVAASEREACAKLCDGKVDAEYATGKVDHNEMGWTQSCAIAIRARGQA